MCILDWGPPLTPRVQKSAAAEKPNTNTNIDLRYHHILEVGWRGPGAPKLPQDSPGTTQDSPGTLRDSQNEGFGADVGADFARIWARKFLGFRVGFGVIFGCRVSPQSCPRTSTRTSPHSPTVSKVSEVLDPSPRELPQDA